MVRPDGEVCLLFKRRVIEQLLDQVHMPEQHSPAAVPLKAQRVQGITKNTQKYGAGIQC